MTDPLFTLIFATALLLGSPGPAPLALAATGATFGFRRGSPFLLGILLGLAFAIVCAAVGLAALFAAFPKARLVVQMLGAAYIAYIAFKIATAPVVTDEAHGHAAPRFVDGFILNLLNPKCYAAFMAIFSQFLLPLSQPDVALATTSVVCFGVAILVDAGWLGLGSVLRPLFREPRRARAIRVFFALLMLLVVAFALI